MCKEDKQVCIGTVPYNTITIGLPEKQITEYKPQKKPYRNEVSARGLDHAVGNSGFIS